MSAVPSVPSLSAQELARYGRQLVLPELGAEGQRRLREARVLLVGAGGLGSPAALYLAAAGVGHLTLVDPDRVDASNLHRQILYGDADVGRPKLEVASERLRALNPHVSVDPVPQRFGAANALDLVSRHDVVIDGTDNFVSRYLVNDACVLAGRPNVFGSVLRFEGQVSVFAAPGGPCYRCLFPEPPPEGLVPSCAEGGVLGVLPGIIGSLQANEVIKLLVGVGEPLIGRLLVFDALALRFREVALPKSPTCPICSPGATVREIREVTAACPGPGAPTKEDAVEEVTPQEVKRWQETGRPFVLLDVRTAQEHALAAIPGARLIPLQELSRRVGELGRGSEIVVHCHHGQRAERAAAFLRGQGFTACTMAGGIDAWSAEVDPSVPRY